jgi:small subunit ribosomal protein S1
MSLLPSESSGYTPQPIEPPPPEEHEPSALPADVRGSSDTTPPPPAGARVGDSSTPAPSAEPEPAPAALDGISGEEIEAMLRQSDAAPSSPSSPVRLGRITEIVGEDVFVDLDDQSKGTVPLVEFSKDDPPVIGREIRVIFEHFNPSGGINVLSKRKADRELAWTRIKPGEIVEGRVTAMNKGGLEVDLGGVRAFMPSSQCDVHRMRDISTLLSLTVRCEVLEVNRGRGEVVVSRRSVLIRDREETRKRMLDEVQEGQVRHGVVGNLTDYGAFVNLGGIDGLLHISDMSWGHVRKASDILRPGQEIEVKVLKIDRAKGKISLGLKQVKPNPWDTIDTKYPVGARVQGRVTHLAEFGAFVELEEGLEGLVPLSEMSWVRRVRKPSDVVQEDAVVDVVVLSVDKDKHRLSLGMKQTESDPWAGVAEQYPKNAMVPGKVLRLAEFGAFVELRPGVEGLVHISEMSQKRISTPRDVVEEGKEVQVRVLGVDVEKRRISLSLKPAPPEAPAAAKPEPEKAKAAKRKKPLRGGLASHWDWASGLGGIRLKG